MNSPMSSHTALSSELKSIISNRNALSMRSRMKVLNDLDENNRKLIEEKEKHLRCQAIEEILTTEATYLQQLEILIEFFIYPIFEKKLLNHILFSTLYGNIKTLYNVSGELIKELKQDPENVANAFYKLAPFFKLYSVYAYDYEQILTLLQTTLESDSVFRNFINQQETRPEIGRKLSSLLITPIQRVPRYKLLLQEVLRHTSSKHKEYNHLQACLVEVEKAASHINMLVAENEESQKLLRLQKRIVNSINLLKPGRKLIKEGPLMRVSRRGNTAYRRYFVLLSDTLLYCKGDPENSLTMCCVLPLNKCKVESILSGGLFRVTCLEETLLLYSKKHESDSWIQSMQIAIKKYTECRQTLKKDSSSRKPLRHNNVYKFPSDNIHGKCIKRKRYEDDHEQQAPLSVSRVMHFNKDDIEDTSIKENTTNCVQLFKKLKRSKDSRDHKNVESPVDNVKFQLHDSDDNFHRLQLLNNSNPPVTDNQIINLTNNPSFARSNLINVNIKEERQSTLRNIGEYFTYIGTRIKELFQFR